MTDHTWLDPVELKKALLDFGTVVGVPMRELYAEWKIQPETRVTVDTGRDLRDPTSLFYRVNIGRRISVLAIPWHRGYEVFWNEGGEDMRGGLDLFIDELTFAKDIATYLNKEMPNVQP